MRARLFLLLALISYSTPGIAQKKFTNPELANQLKEKFKDSEVVAKKFTSVYTFEIVDSELIVNEINEADLISLKSNVKYRRPVFYDDQSKIKSGYAKYSSGRGVLRDEKVCGNYEIEGIFYSDAKVCNYVFDILYEASEISFYAEKHYDDPRYLTKVFFHDQDPALHREVKFIIPNSVNVELAEIKFDGFEIKKLVEEQDGNKIYTYSIGNIKELKGESNSLGFMHEYPHILVLTKSYRTESETIQVIASVDDLYNWYAELVSRVEVSENDLKSEVDNLIAKAESDEEKIRNIYYWVQENIKYIAFEDGLAGFQPAAPQDVYQNRFGDCKGMAILTKTMLNIAGFDARLTWIGTNKIPYSYDHASMAADNHMICTLEHEGKQYILDATEKYIALGEHSERIQGKEMLIENGETYIRKKVPIESADKNLILRTEKLKLEGEDLIGEGELQVNGEAKKMILYLSTNSKVENQSKLYDFLSVSDYTNTDLVKVNNTPDTDRDEPLDIQYNYKLGNKVNGFDNDLFIDLDWDKTYKNLKIEDDRFGDYYFGRKVKNKIVKTLEIPENYEVSHLPEALDIQYKDILIKARYENKGRNIIYSNEITIESGKIAKEDFKEWNELLKKLNALYDDQIIITKIS